jgi:hypothetical protein
VQERKNAKDLSPRVVQFEFREVKIEPVNNLVAELEEISAKAVARLNAPRKLETEMSGCRCPCEYCRHGRCDLHDAILRRERDLYLGSDRETYGLPEF